MIMLVLMKMLLVVMLLVIVVRLWLVVMSVATVVPEVGGGSVGRKRAWGRGRAAERGWGRGASCPAPQLERGPLKFLNFEFLS